MWWNRFWVYFDSEKLRNLQPKLYTLFLVSIRHKIEILKPYDSIKTTNCKSNFFYDLAGSNNSNNHHFMAAWKIKKKGPANPASEDNWMISEHIIIQTTSAFLKSTPQSYRQVTSTSRFRTFDSRGSSWLITNLEALCGDGINELLHLGHIYHLSSKLALSTTYWCQDHKNPVGKLMVLKYQTWIRTGKSENFSTKMIFYFFLQYSFLILGVTQSLPLLWFREKGNREHCN